MNNIIGTGCTTRQIGLPQHNPTPSTARGKRRHNNRNESQKKIAEKAWNTSRSTRKSRYQEKMVNNE